MDAQSFACSETEAKQSELPRKSRNLNKRTLSSNVRDGYA